MASLLRVVARDIDDARLDTLSTDRRFATAYNAALQLATIVLRAEGYRTSGSSHHHTTLIAVRELMGPAVEEVTDYFDACRARRNTVDYDGVGIATESDVEELIDEVLAFRGTVITWMRANHPDLLG